jgi:hypothetical protein
MCRVLRWSGWIVLIAFIVPLLGADEPKKDKTTPPRTEEKKAEKKAADAKAKDDKKPADGDDAKKKVVAPAKASTSPKFKYTLLWELVKMGKVEAAPKFGIIIKERYVNGNKIDVRDKEVELDSAENLLVRTEIPPARFDDKGNAITKPLTFKEREALRGPDKTLPGFTADVDSLKPGQVVNVYLAPKKNAAKTDLPVIVLIHILAEPSN